MILEGYTFNSNGKEYNLAAYKDFEELENSYQNDYTVYFLTDENVFVLGGYVIAEGDLSGLSDVEPPMRVSAYKRKSIERKIKMLNDFCNTTMGYESKPQPEMRYGHIESNRRKYTPETELCEVSEEKPKSFDMEIEKVESMGFKTADTGEMVMELSIPTTDELDSYFSSIGLRLPEVG